MDLKKGQRYPLLKPTTFDDEFGEGFGYAEPVTDCNSSNTYVVDCFITDKEGKRHPGIETPVPVRLEDINDQVGYDLDAKSSILDLLKAGGSITLPWGYELQGDPDHGYIQLLTPSMQSDLRSDREDGLCHLSEKGLDEAFGYARKYRDDELEAQAS